jgi:hypothetical protein
VNERSGRRYHRRIGRYAMRHSIFYSHQSVACFADGPGTAHRRRYSPRGFVPTKLKMRSGAKFTTNNTSSSTLSPRYSAYGSRALALGARPRRGSGADSVDTSSEIAGFGFDSLGRPAAPHADAGGFQVATDRLAADAGRLLDAGQRPAHTPECADLLLFLVVQDVTHAG